MFSKNSSIKKILSVIMSILLVSASIPYVAISAFAATDDCLATNVGQTKVYFYGMDSIETDDMTVTYTGGNSNVDSVYVDGVKLIDTADLTFDTNSITFTSDWLDVQAGWIAVRCDSDSVIPSDEPNVDVDETAPVISEVTGNPTDWVTTATLSVVSSDSDVFSYSIDGTNWQESADFEIDNNKTYSLYVKDTSGNVSDAFEVDVEKIDAVKPIISVGITPESWTNEKVTFAITASDAGCGLHTAPYKMDNGEWQESNDFEVEDNTTHTFYVRDALENTSSTVKTADKYDKTKPTFTSISVKSGSTEITVNGFAATDFTRSDKDYTFTVVAEDNASGVAAYACDDSAWQASNEFTLKGAATSYTFKIKDNAGNIETQAFTMKNDITAPTISSVTLSTEDYTNKTVKFTVNASDTESGLNSTAYKMDNGAWQASNVFDVNDCKEHTFSVRDNAKADANVATITKQAPKYSTKLPTISSVTLSTENWTNQTIVFTVNAKAAKNEANVTIPLSEYKMDNGAWQASNAFNVNDCKEHSFYVKDKAGNVSEVSKKTAPNFDAVAPVLNGSAENAAIKFDQQNNNALAAFLNKLTFGKFFNNTVVIKAKLKDVASETSNVSGIVSAKFVFISSDASFKVEQAAKAIKDATESKVEFDIPAKNLPENFNGTAQIIVVDAAGNKVTFDVTTANSNIGATEFMIENDAPVITNTTASDSMCAITTDETTQEVQSGTIKSDFNFEFTVNDVTDKNYSGIAYVSVKVNGVEVMSNDGLVSYQGADSMTSNESYSLPVIAQNEDNQKAYTVNGIALDDNWNDGVLTFEINTCDNAGNVSETKTVVYSIDQTAPVITDYEIGGIGSKSVKMYDEYNFYFNKTTTVTIKANDFTGSNKEVTASGVKSITAYLEDVDGTIYVVTENNSVITNEIEGVKVTKENATPVDTDELVFTIPANFKGQIYAYATDNAGNSPKNCVYFADEEIAKDGYVNPDGSIVEDGDKHSNESSIEFGELDYTYTENHASPYSSEQINSIVKDSFTNNDIQVDQVMNYESNYSAKNVALYDKGSQFSVKVEDTYSGIKSVKYMLIDGGSQTSYDINIDSKIDQTTSTSFSAFNSGDISIREATANSAEKWSVAVDSQSIVYDSNIVTSFDSTITVDGNYNDMILLVAVTDRARNISYDYIVFGIDQTNPEIRVEYESKVAPESINYYREARTAHIFITERNISTENINLLIEKCTAAIRRFDVNDTAPVLSTYVINNKNIVVPAEGNGDNKTYRIDVNFSAEGNYRIKTLNCVDYVKRSNKAIVFENTQSESNKDTLKSKLGEVFTIDNTDPKIYVTYTDKAPVANGKYFKDSRTATIKVVEHNFDPSRVNWTEPTRTASNPATANPSPTEWHSEGDSHFCDIVYDKDGDYTFDISMIDMSGRVLVKEGVDYDNFDAPKEFTIDTTYANLVTVTGIEKGGVLGLSKNGEMNENAQISIKFDDINFEKYAITLSRTRVLVNGETQNETVEEVISDNLNAATHSQNLAKSSNPEYKSNATGDIIGSQATGNSNATVTFNIPKRDKQGVKNDGLYSLRIQASDMAGNTYDDNVANEIQFSVNRYGSVYTISEDICDLVNNEYTNKIDKDLEIKTYSATPLSNAKVSISRNDSLLENVKWNESIVNADEKRQTDGMQWHEYTYIIDKENFSEDGLYIVNVESTDVNSINSSQADYDVCSVSFTVDSKAPDIITSLDNHKELFGRITENDTALNVDYDISDLYGIKEITIEYTDENGNTQLLTTNDLEGFTAGLNNYKGTIVLNESKHNRVVKIVVKDNANNSTEYVKDSITVSTNFFYRWYATKPLFIGSIAAAVVAVGGGVTFFALRFRKKERMLEEK